MTLRNWITLLRAQVQCQDGQTMAEYGVVLGVITLGVIVAIGALATAITGNFGAITKVLSP